MLDVKEVSFTYESQSQPALKNISFHLGAGEVLCLTGKSGCGKTTVSRLLNGLIPELYEGQEKGSCQLDQSVIETTPIYQLSQRIGSVFQNPKTQFFTTDVTSELAFPLENQGMERARIRSRLDEVAQLFGIEHLLNRSMFALSGGEKQMVAIASSYMLKPNVLLLDEPSSNLDEQAIDSLALLLKKLKQQGISMIIIEHRLYYLKDLVDRFIVIENGAIGYEFNPQEMMDLDRVKRQDLGLRALTLTQYREDTNQHLQELTDKKAVQSWITRDVVDGDGSETFSEHLLSLHEVSYTYKETAKPALSIGSLQLNSNDITAIIGHNGAGKTTLAKIIAGLARTESKSHFRLDGKEVKEEDLNRQSFLVFQDASYQLFCESVEKELLLGAPSSSRGKMNEVAESLELVDLLHRNPNSLSGGQKQRVAIGCAVLSGKRIVIMDEPTSGLDLAHMQQVTQAIRYLQSLGTIVLVISHDREFLESTCSRFVTLDQGHIVNDKPRFS